MKTSHLFLFKLSVAILCLSWLNCTTETTLPQNNKTLSNTMWRLTAYADQFNNLTIIDFKDRSRTAGWYHIDFKGNDTTLGFDNCNSFSGRYKVGNGAQITFDSVMQTLVYCPGSLDFLPALQEANYYEYTGSSSLEIITKLPNLRILYFIPDTTK